MQAPKQRHDTRGGDRRGWGTLLIVAGLGFVGLAAVGLLFAFGGRDAPGDATSELKAAGCKLQIVDASTAGIHVTTPPKRSVYNTWPPTSGPHDPVPPPWDLYTEPIEQYRLVHNLEHGGVVVQYGKNVPKEEVAKIAAWWRNDPNGIVVAPFPELDDAITLGAWTGPPSSSAGDEELGQAFLATCTTFNENAFDAFKNDYGFRGPELFPRELLTPGA